MHWYATCKIRKRKCYDTSRPIKRQLTVYGTYRPCGVSKNAKTFRKQKQQKQKWKQKRKWKSKWIFIFVFILFFIVVSVFMFVFVFVFSFSFLFCLCFCFCFCFAFIFGFLLIFFLVFILRLYYGTYRPLYTFVTCFWNRRKPSLHPQEE